VLLNDEMDAFTVSRAGPTCNGWLPGEQNRVRAGQAPAVVDVPPTIVTKTASRYGGGHALLQPQSSRLCCIRSSNVIDYDRHPGSGDARAFNSKASRTKNIENFAEPLYAQSGWRHGPQVPGRNPRTTARPPGRRAVAEGQSGENNRF